MDRFLFEDDDDVFNEESKIENHSKSILRKRRKRYTDPIDYLKKEFKDFSNSIYFNLLK